MWQNQHVGVLLLGGKLVQTLPGPALVFFCRQNRLGSSTGPEETTEEGEVHRECSLSAAGRGLLFFWGLRWLAVGFAPVVTINEK